MDRSQGVWVVCGPQLLLGLIMKTNTTFSPALTNILLHVLAYLLWLVTIVVCVAAVIQLRSAINVLWVVLGGDRHLLGLANQLSLLLGSLVAVIYIVFLEGYYRQSITRRGHERAGGDATAHTPAPPSSRVSRWLNTLGLTVLLRRFAMTLAIPLGLCIVSLGVIAIGLRGLR